MVKIAVITALNPGNENPGMLTVDLAFDQVMHRLPRSDGEPATSVSWFTHATPDREETRDYIDAGTLPFSFRPLAENLEEIYDHDRIVFWGDFLQARNYHTKDVANQSRRVGLPFDAAAGFLLRDAPDDVIGRTILFGGTRVCDEPEVLEIPEYADPLQRLVRGARGVWARESETAATYAGMRGVKQNECLGIDAAFLLESAQGTENTIGIFAGTRTKVPAGFSEFCKHIARKIDAKPRWIQWLRFHGRKTKHWRRHLARWSLGRQGRQTGFREMVNGLAAHRLVITDTYHVCVNAWRQGTPAICLSTAEPRSSDERTTLNQRKKILLYEMLGASDFTFEVPPEGITDPRSEAERFVAAMARTTDIVKGIRERSTAAERALAIALTV